MCTRCVYARRCLPCSFLRSSINETRVQSRRMSNKYVSCLPPSRPCRTVVPLPHQQTTYPLHPLPSQPLALPLLVALLRESSSYHGPIPSPTAHFNPFAYSCLPSTSVCSPFWIQTASRARFVPAGWFDPERNHRSIRAYMLLTALILLSARARS